MNGLFEFTIQFYDNQSDQWKKATIISGSQDSALGFLDSMVPRGQRTRLANGMNADTTEVILSRKLITTNYLVAVEKEPNPVSNWQPETLLAVS